ncbi:S8 family serine peptidase [Vallicoccus soli]|uniref:Peptidase S8/S53 domain-containing protein n=1 Tax=Vallicoccus soli TaxID=2339232 RepID=A0A3A3Z1T5_9ACTN|nr:S8 family serine peptidase [Vallicoccus soli]RJK98229.1 hypothetical protein D5H78_04860 [Vallicoccus soli]
MAGSDYRDGFPDPRPEDVRAAHRAAVGAQVGALSSGAQREAFVRRVDERRLERRRGRRDLEPVEVLDDGAGRTLVRPGDLLAGATAADDERAVRLLADEGFTVEPVAELGGRVLRCRRDGVPPARLEGLAGELRALGHLASVDHVVPLAPVVKGLSGPEPSPVGVPRPTASARAGAGVRVAVVDTGITPERRADGWLDAVPREGEVDPLDDLPEPNGLLDLAAGHGTFVAGVVAQVAPGAELRAYRAVDSDGIGSDLEIALALVRALRDGADVVNLSFGVQTPGDVPPVALQAAVDILAEEHPEALVVAAAGNDGSDRPSWPAAFREVVAVGALDVDLAPAPWSNRGHWVDCSAVGEGVLSTYVPGVEDPEFDPAPDTYPADAWAVWTGTSFAAPQVAGLVARVAAERGTGVQEAWRTVQRAAVRVPGAGRVVPVLQGTTRG